MKTEGYSKKSEIIKEYGFGIIIFVYHSDVKGNWSRVQCGIIADLLKSVLHKIDELDDGRILNIKCWGKTARKFIDGLDECYKNKAKAIFICNNS